MRGRRGTKEKRRNEGEIALRSKQQRPPERRQAGRQAEREKHTERERERERERRAS